MLKQAVLTVLAVASVSTSALLVPAMLTPAAAQASLNVVIATPPPAPVYEVVPPPRAGYVWAPGYYRWEGGRHVWTTGYWMPERVGYRWIPDRWDHGPNGWYHVAGRWDRNGNGIPDRYEHRADSRPWSDRDRDGIPNAYDHHPDNPYRR